MLSSHYDFWKGKAGRPVLKPLGGGARSRIPFHMRSECTKGHPFPENLYISTKISPKGKGRSAYCKLCNRQSQRLATWRRSGITINHDDFDNLLETQGGRCAICGTNEPTVRRGKSISLAVDHSHETGGVRGVLCFKCNVGLGYFDDCPELLLEAAAYLNR
jgi:hypothetical protein